MALFRKKWPLSALLVLTSCMVSLPKQQQTENLITQPTLNQSVNESLETPFFSIGEWPSAEWWEVFNSPELNFLIGVALQQNPSLQEVRRRIEYAKQEAVIARSRLFPFISFDADDDWQYLSKNGLYRALNPNIPIAPNLIDIKLNFSYEFDFWGQNRNLFTAALGEFRAQEAEAQEVKLVITTAVAQSYFALKTNILRKGLFERLAKIREEVLNLQERLRKSALLSALPPLFSQESSRVALQEVVGIDEEIAIDQHLLNALTGNGPDAPLCIDATLAPLPATIAIPRTLSLDLLARRPDLMVQIWRSKALADRVGAAIADFFPNIDITAFVGFESVRALRLFSLSSATFGVKPALHLPIFTAGAIRANVRATKAKFDAAIFEYNNLVLKSAQEVADLLVVAESIFAQKQEQEEIVRAAKARYTIAILRLQKGLDSLLQTYAIEEELIQRELDDVDLLYNQYLAAIRLIKALGGGYLSPCIPLQAGECS